MHDSSSDEYIVYISYAFIFIAVRQAVLDDVAEGRVVVERSTLVYIPQGPDLALLLKDLGTY
jgi:hypothetical protein